MTLSQEAARHMAMVMMAFAEGKVIEFRSTNSEGSWWKVAENPAWDWSKFQYRIKPDVPEYMEVGQVMDKIRGLEERISTLEERLTI